MVQPLILTQYLDGEGSKAPYCGMACQIAYWPIHKEICIVRQARALFRAGNLDSKVFISYRMYLFDKPIKKVEHDGEDTIIQEAFYDDVEASNPFAHDLIPETGDMIAVSTSLAGTYTLAYMNGLIVALLKG